MKVSVIKPIFLLATAVLLCTSVGAVFAQDKPALTVYTTTDFGAGSEHGLQLVQDFEATCECDLKLVDAGSAISMLDRVKSEGEESVADVILGIDNALAVEAQNTGLISEHQIDMSPLNVPFAWDNQNFLPYDFGFFGFVYDNLRTPNPPKSFEQLLQSDNSLKLVIQDPRTSTSGLGLMLWIKALYGEQAADIWQQLAPKIVKVTNSRQEAYRLFLEREADMVLSYTTSPAFHMVKENESKYQASPFKEGHSVQIELAAQLKSSKNPELAQQFLQYLVSEAFQNQIATTQWMYPVLFPKDGLPTQFRQLVRPVKSLAIDAQGIADNKADWIDEFNQALNR